MSYRSPSFLTVVLLAFAGALHAQNASFRDALSRLASPTAAERTSAIESISALKGDIAPQLRIAFKNASTVERCGLVEAAELRGDGALVAQAVEAVAAHEAAPDSDSRLAHSARAYLLALPEAQVACDEGALDASQKKVLADLRTYRLRRDLTVMLLDSVQKPGKYLDQFETLRARVGGALQDELLVLAHLREGISAPLADGAARRYQAGTEAERVYSAEWRRLSLAQGSLEQAYDLLRDPAAQQELRSVNAPLLAAVEVLQDMRTAAIRALAADHADADLAATLRALHQSSQASQVAPLLRAVSGLEVFRTEIELTLARAGDRELLDARIEALRAQVERAQEAAGTLNAKVNGRPDIAARNEVAHLLLRSGDAEGAETEWLAVVQLVRDGLRLAKDLQRGSVASALGSVYYNLACAQSLQLKLTRAGQSLESARLYGYRDFNWMLEDGDLDALRGTPEFRTWFRRVAPPASVDRLDAGDKPAGATRD